MDTEKLLDLVKRFKENRNFITNEETAKMALVVPFLRCLGYDPNNPREVRLEFRAEFTQGDGKKYPDQMDFAIFDKTGVKPRMVVETKPLGANLKQKAQQLARYIGQMPELHFGIITDGCLFLFFGDLDQPNVMDDEPFFRFSLDEDDTDWAKVAKFLSKFSRDAFDAETLVKDAENSAYRQAMIDRIVGVLRAPAADAEFMKWLTKGVYKGNKTTAVMTRLGEIACEAIEPALLRAMSDDFLEKLKQRMRQLRETGKEDAAADRDESSDSSRQDGAARLAGTQQHNGVVTTADELELYEIVREICSKSGIPREDVLYHDTSFWFNVSYKRPKRWFLRYLGNRKHKRLVTLVSSDEARALLPGYQVKERNGKSGGCFVHFDRVEQIREMKDLIVRSLVILKTTRHAHSSNGGNGGQSPPSLMPDDLDRAIGIE
ncbi:MAG: type I restriction enzyme HsdR N-terminal domain-containing protein [Planctomycetales bacterium]